MDSSNPNYHRHSVRLPRHDYSQPGAYFITICTHNRQCLFGEIVDGEIMMNEFGELVKTEWQKTGIIRPNIVIDAFVIMPNHLHGILIINDEFCYHRDTLQRVSMKQNIFIIIFLYLNYYLDFLLMLCEKV